MIEAETLLLAARQSPVAWFETYGRILDKAGKIVAAAANDMQQELGAIYEYCRDHGIPCRIIGLKPRQTGLSTISVAVMYTHLRNYVAKGCVIGDEYEKSVKNLVDKFENYEANDAFPWGNTFRRQSAKFSHGSELVTDTANDPRAGASLTLQFLIGTEVAHWPETGVRSAAQTLAAILNCVPEQPNTVVILESTPNGASGVFYETYQGAVTFEELKAGKRGNGYVKIFYPWFRHPEYEVKDFTQEEFNELGARMTQDMLESERERIAQHQLRPGHVMFRRRLLASPKFNWDEKLVDQEYPSDEETCFLTSGRTRFDQGAIKRMDEIAQKTSPEYGIIDGKFGGHVLRNTARDEAWVYIWERPKNGCRYIMAVDPMTGISQTGGKNPDAHSVLVYRLGYHSNGRFHKPKVVARVFPDCRVEIDMLSTFVLRLSAYYGNCCVVPEVNNSGIALIELLKPFNIDLYERELFNFRESKWTTALGWQTKDGAGRDGTRSMAIGNLAADIRDENIEILCPHILKQCRTFIVKDNGRAEALPGKHDDDVLALAIAVTTQERATMYRMTERSMFTPYDSEPRQRRVVSNQYS